MERNQVTPAHLGQRVSLQFSLPNGYLSEVVGVIEMYDEDAHTYFIKKKDGEVVRVPEDGIRFGKVVSTPAP